MSQQKTKSQIEPITFPEEVTISFLKKPTKEFLLKTPGHRSAKLVKVQDVAKYHDLAHTFSFGETTKKSEMFAFAVCKHVYQSPLMGMMLYKQFYEAYVQTMSPYALSLQATYDLKPMNEYIRENYKIYYGKVLVDCLDPVSEKTYKKKLIFTCIPVPRHGHPIEKEINRLFPNRNSLGRSILYYGLSGGRLPSLGEGVEVKDVEVKQFHLRPYKANKS